MFQLTTKMKLLKSYFLSANNEKAYGADNRTRDVVPGSERLARECSGGFLFGVDADPGPRSNRHVCSRPYVQSTAQSAVRPDR